MPGLVAFGRRWEIGADDLVFPIFAESVIRASWLIAISVIVNLHSSSFNCDSGFFLKLFYIGTLVITALHIIISIFIIYHSGLGGIMDTLKRKHVPKLIYIKLLVAIPELAWIILGTYWAFADSTNCNDTIVLTVKVAAIVAWGVLIIFIIGVMLVFDPLGTQHRRKNSNDTKKHWENRCSLLCCCVASDDQSQNAFSDVAELLTEYFEGLDLVATDIAAGLFLVKDEQESQPIRYTHEPLLSFDFLSDSHSSPVTQELTLNDAEDGTTDDYVSNQTQQPRSSSANPNELQGISDSIEQDVDYHMKKAFPQPKPWMTLYDASHYMKYALASYGWPLYVYMNPICGCCKLWKGCRSCSDTGSNVVEDNCCQCNMTAIQFQANIDSEDVIYASFYNRIYEIPFYVVLDHERASIVIAIRGTLSLRDTLTDLTADCEDIDIDHIGTCPTHRGILLAAKFIQNTLVQNRVIQRALERGPEYSLVICGHSLGAGCAALLSLLLKPQYPQLKCFAFSPPGGLMSLPLSRYCEDFIMSVVVGNDIIPRLSIVSLEGLKTKLLRNIKESSKPKYKILTTGLVKGISACIAGNEPDSSRRLLSGQSSRGSQYTEVNIPTEDEIEDAIQTCQHNRRIRQNLYPPGHILLIEDILHSRGLCQNPTYESAWARAEVFSEILVSQRMVHDHFPNIVFDALNELSEKDNNPSHYVKISSEGTVSP